MLDAPTTSLFAYKNDPRSNELPASSQGAISNSLGRESSRPPPVSYGPKLLSLRCSNRLDARTTARLELRDEPRCVFIYQHRVVHRTLGADIAGSLNHSFTLPSVFGAQQKHDGCRFCRRTTLGTDRATSGWSPVRLLHLAFRKKEAFYHRGVSYYELWSASIGLGEGGFRDIYHEWRYCGELFPFPLSRAP